MPKFRILYCIAIQNIQNKWNSLTYWKGIEAFQKHNEIQLCGVVCDADEVESNIASHHSIS